MSHPGEHPGQHPGEHPGEHPGGIPSSMPGSILGSISIDIYYVYYIALAGRPLRGLLKWVPRVGETPFSEKVRVSPRRKPLFPRPSDLNGGHEGFDNECAQVPRLRTEMSMMKTRGAPAANTYLRFTRMGSIFFCWSFSVGADGVDLGPGGG